jgi:hypothetical protein
MLAIQTASILNPTCSTRLSDQRLMMTGPCRVSTNRFSVASSAAWTTKIHYRCNEHHLIGKKSLPSCTIGIHNRNLRFPLPRFPQKRLRIREFVIRQQPIPLLSRHKHALHRRKQQPWHHHLRRRRDMFRRNTRVICVRHPRAGPRLVVQVFCLELVECELATCSVVSGEKWQRGGESVPRISSPSAISRPMLIVVPAIPPWTGHSP